MRTANRNLSKVSMTSRHPWYTPSGFAARFFYALALTLPVTGVYEIALALIYGAIEEFGLAQSVTLIFRVKRAWKRSLIVLRRKHGKTR